MKKILAIIAAVTLAATLATAGQQPAKKLKVFISVDMEGVSGLINWDETAQGGPDYPLFRKLMTAEANAAIAGALEAGATEIVVRDAHDSARNILPDELRPEARLIREWNGPLSMMEGIDKTFDAVVFIGYHARAGTPDAVLKHTMSLSLFDVILNGVRLPEAGWNAAIAGYFFTAFRNSSRGANGNRSAKAAASISGWRMSCGDARMDFRRCAAASS